MFSTTDHHEIQDFYRIQKTEISHHSDIATLCPSLKKPLITPSIPNNTKIEKSAREKAAKIPGLFMTEYIQHSIAQNNVKWFARVRVLFKRMKMLFMQLIIDKDLEVRVQIGTREVLILL